MKYMLLIHLTDEALPIFETSEADRIFGAHNLLQKELRETGELVDTHELMPERSRVIRTVKGETLVTDGPFTESKEWAAGYYIVDCVDIDRATEIAGRLVESEYSPIEIRELG